MATQQQLLLLEDVDDVGRSGDIVKVKAGYARNFLLPQKKAVTADRNAVRMQERLQAERRKKADDDRKISEKLCAEIEGAVFTTEVKVDPEGHMYGSVSVSDIQQLIQEQKGLELGKKAVTLSHPIKKTGVYDITLRLQEGVTAEVKLKVIPEGGVLPEAPAEEAEAPMPEEPIEEEPIVEEAPPTKEAEE